MKPIGELPAVVAQSLVGVAFDVDDTITHEGRLELPAYEAMWKLRAAGLRLMAVTGRPLGWADVLARQWPIDVAIGENGAGWIHREAARFHEGYFASQAERDANQERLSALLVEVKRKLPHIVLAQDQRARRCDMAFDIGESEQVPPEDVAKLCRLIESAGALAAVSSVHAHAVFGDWNKARGIVRAAQAVWGDDVEAFPARWLFIGDSGNDAPAFSFFPVTAGVANVVEHLQRLPKAPAYVATLPRGRGFAEIASHILRLRQEPLA
ncbi:MAG: HAD-IIB family hydrolase [Deltaproteobacteria bacterium]|nr:HAD-IIB family hydrolase [Deltaproteobacteria bacterium]